MYEVGEGCEGFVISADVSGGLMLVWVCLVCVGSDRVGGGGIFRFVGLVWMVVFGSESGLFVFA